MNFIHTFRAEIFKTKRTAVFYLCFIMAFIPPFMMFCFAGEDKEPLQRIMNDPWYAYLRNSGDFLYFMFLPGFVILQSTLIPQLEYRNATWKQVLSSPQPKLNIYGAKFATVQVYTLFFLIVYVLLVFISLIAFNAFRFDVKLWQHGLDITKTLSFIGKAYVAVLGMSALQFWIGMRSKSFITPIGIGIGAWLIGVFSMFEFKWEDAYFIPHTISVFSILPKFEGKFNTFVLVSLAYMLVFFTAGYFDFKFKKLKA